MTADQNPGREKGLFSKIVDKLRRHTLQGFSSSPFSEKLGQEVDNATLLRQQQQEEARRSSDANIRTEIFYADQLRNRYAEEQQHLSHEAEVILNQFGIRSKLDEVRKKAWKQGKIIPYYSEQSAVNVGSVGLGVLDVRKILTGYDLNAPFKGVVSHSDPENNMSYTVETGATHLLVNVDFSPLSYKVKDNPGKTGVEKDEYVRQHAPFIMGRSYVDVLGCLPGSEAVTLSEFSASVHDLESMSKLEAWLLEDSKARITRHLLPKDLQKKGENEINGLRRNQ